jgi:hypothetical protein
MVPQPQIHFAKHNLKNLRGPLSILNISERGPIFLWGFQERLSYHDRPDIGPRRKPAAQDGVFQARKKPRPILTRSKPFPLRPHFRFPAWTLIRIL